MSETRNLTPDSLKQIKTPFRIFSKPPLKPLYPEIESIPIFESHLTKEKRHELVSRLIDFLKIA